MAKHQDRVSFEDCYSTHCVVSYRPFDTDLSRLNLQESSLQDLKTTLCDQIHGFQGLPQMVLKK